MVEETGNASQLPRRTVGTYIKLLVLSILIHMAAYFSLLLWIREDEPLHDTYYVSIKLDPLGWLAVPALAGILYGLLRVRDRLKFGTWSTRQN